MRNSFKKYITRNLLNVPGWRTKKKIVVFESDDWGSIRMSSQYAYQSLLKEGYPINDDLYNIYDSLETSEDLVALFETLNHFKDQNGNHPIITANTIVGNPDFEKIKQSNFSRYYFESFTETLNRRANNDGTFRLWQQGINNRFFKPQFHGREHVNVHYWLNALRKKDAYFLKAFEYGVFGINNMIEGNRSNYMAAFDYATIDQLENIKIAVKEGLQLFESIFGFKSRTLIAPCYVWSHELEAVANEEGVRAIQGIPYQYMPCIGRNAYQKEMHFTGSKNKYGQTYLIRNAFFEPTLEAKNFSVDGLLKRIETAFIWGKPAIIGSHRINYIGSLVEANRTNNLNSLKSLLTAILKKWPDVEFMSSDQLSELIENSRSGDNKMDL